MEANLKCHKCGAPMVEGFLHDEGNAGKFSTRWVAGKPEMGFLGTVKVSGKEQHPVQSFRCSQCGCLEFFACDR